MKNNVKKRNWAFVLYPESAPSDWREQLKKSGLLCAVSPLHDKDLDPTGEPKKAHHHVIVVYSGPTTYNAVASFTASLNATIPQPLESVKGMYRYLTHKDNPEKYQYEEHEILTLNGFNIADLVELTNSEVSHIKKEILKLIREADIIEYADLIDILNDNEMFTEADVAMNHTFFFNSYIASRRNSYSRAKDKIEAKRVEAELSLVK
ncbi:MAG: replication protein [Clostridia bacterium]|nr:replication protein [Clostridia bacterium]